MRKLSCWLIIAVLTIHMSAYSMYYTNDTIDFEMSEIDDISQTSGRDSHQMQGNEDDTNPCNFNNSADGLGGPVWDSSVSYNLHDVVEYPADSGHFWQSTTAGPTAAPNSTGKWNGPCSCEQIAEESGIVWDSSVAYDPWQILDYNGAIWFVQDAGTNAGDVPQEGSDLWVLCKESCTSVISALTPVWQNSTLVTEGEVYEYPANSGNFYAVVGTGMVNQTVGAPGADLDAWGEPCGCKEIWFDSGEPAWDQNNGYPVNSVVEHPAGTNNLYIALVDILSGVTDQPDLSPKWGLCVSGDEPSSNPCEEYNGTGGKTWTNTSYVSSGQIYQYPANSGMFYMVSPGISNQLVGAPGMDMDAWSEKGCTCEEIWEAGGQMVWDSTIVYSAASIVEHPANTGHYWLAIAPSTTAGVEPGEPWADGNEWELCGPEDNTSSGPCGGLDYSGAWYDDARVSTGEIYEYPAGSQNYYEVVIQGYLDQEVLSPTTDLDVWAPVECPCEETWETNGQPVWDSSVTYATDSVVEWPAGSMMLYIASPAPGPGDEPGVDPEWELCSAPDEPSGGPCAGLNVVGVWSSGMNVTSGDVYQYPAGSSNYYIVNPGSPFWSVSAPDIDMDVWSPIDCPCKETWVANGEPVWDISVMYWLDEVVEWPAGSGILWIAIDNGFSQSEPSLTALDWEHCADSNMPYSNPCAGLDVLGVWTNSTQVMSGEIYEYPAGSQTYYQVNQGGPFTNVNAPDVDLDVWSPIDCPCKETWVANGQPVWVAGTAYPGDYVVEHPAGSGNLYIPLESGGVTTGGGEPGIDIHWVLCNGDGPSPGPCDGLNVPVWDNTTAPAVGDIYEYPANSGTYFQIIFVHSGTPNDWIANPVMDGSGDEFWKPYNCPCKETWEANGNPVWDSTVSFYQGNYVVEWPAGSGDLYISEAGGITGAGEPGIDGHWIPCEGDGVIDEATPEKVKEDKEDSVPSIGVFATLLGFLAASAFVRRKQEC
ncbi:MAG: hypothetical protein ACPG73_05765 [Candidatus Poseidoniaceae archaeon]